MKIKKNTWHYKMISKDKLGYDYDDLMPKDLCSYFWSLMWGLASRASVFTVLSFFGAILLNIIVAEWLYGWYALVQYGEDLGLWNNHASVFYTANLLIVVVPIILGFMKFTSSNIVTQRIADFKEGRCSLIEYEDDDCD